MTSSDRPEPGRPGPAFPPVIRGCWQLSRDHGPGWTREVAFEALNGAAAEGGVLVLDCGDIYTGVEELLGDWLSQRPELRGRVKVHTKFVPDFDMLTKVDGGYVRRIVERSLSRLRLDTLPLVQFAWWTHEVPGWVEAAQWLVELRDEGLIEAVGVTNFDAHHLRGLLDTGLPIVSNQVQLSLVDRRAERDLLPLCREHGVAVLCYGTLAGGLLSERWLGQVDPGSDFVSRSFTKYRLIVDEVGGWDAHQATLGTLRRIADDHESDMGSVAASYVLQKWGVASVIIGLSRPRSARPAIDTGVPLTVRDIDELTKSVSGRVPGPVFGVERDRSGPHGRIMKYDLNG